MRVAFVLRSTEVHPAFFWFVLSCLVSHTFFCEAGLCLAFKANSFIPHWGHNMGRPNDDAQHEGSPTLGTHTEGARNHGGSQKHGGSPKRQREPETAEGARNHGGSPKPRREPETTEGARNHGGRPKRQREPETTEGDRNLGCRSASLGCRSASLGCRSASLGWSLVSCCGFRLLTQVGFRLVPGWFQAGPSLVSGWLQVGFRVRPQVVVSGCWFQVQSLEHSPNHPITQPITQSLHHPTNDPIAQSFNQSHNHPITQPITKSRNHVN